ncbi:MAG: class I SAM-dependent methyltransferase [Deltaproteobacteria bacterium]|nr:class I SAM-dependent methyltransferase [Deltaproteobacteria bacterium]
MSRPLAQAPDPARFYEKPAAAWIRATRPELGDGSDLELVRVGLAAGMRLQRFKRSQVLPRVRSILGILHGLSPSSLLDIGSGRGAFLWPLLETFPTLDVTAIDASPVRAEQLRAVASGGVSTLRAHPMDAASLAFEDRSFDVVTALEVLEHVPDFASAVREIARVARRFVLVTVPSRPDDNPEHLHLLDTATLQSAFMAAGALRVSFESILNHRIVTVRLP